MNEKNNHREKCRHNFLGRSDSVGENCDPAAGLSADGPDVLDGGAQLGDLFQLLRVIGFHLRDSFLEHFILGPHFHLNQLQLLALLSLFPDEDLHSVLHLAALQWKREVD